MEDSAETDQMPDGQDLIAEGYDPLYVAYILVQNFASQFSEGVSQFPELEEYVEIVGSAEDEYMPDAPPVSPLTRSYFCTWAFFDVRFGPDRETIGTCMLDLVSLLGIADFAEAIRNYQESRMGIYEHLGRRKSLIRLRELVTGTEYRCQCPSGYVGRKGELWYVRLCPPIADLADYHVAVTTPYVLLNASREDWTAYLRKNLSRSVDNAEALHQFLKYGPTPRHWQEFVFQGYHHHQTEAIFLAGLPDVKGSLPNAERDESGLS